MANGNPVDKSSGTDGSDLGCGSGREIDRKERRNTAHSHDGVGRSGTALDIEPAGSGHGNAQGPDRGHLSAIRRRVAVNSADPHESAAGRVDAEQRSQCRSGHVAIVGDMNDLGVGAGAGITGGVRKGRIRSGKCSIIWIKPAV